jgi:hypothetical protein
MGGRSPTRRIYENLSALDLRERAAAFERFAVWESSQRALTSPQQAIEAIGFLYDLLPEEARDRPVDPSGVIEMHRRLAVLSKLK